MQNRGAMQASLDYIEENLRAEITARELADRAGFSLFHYYRLFQSATGMPVMQYITRRKLLHALYAISRGDAMIDAAMAYGFDTYAGFYKAFRREFGCTPSVFLKRYGAKKPHRIDLFREEHIMVTRKKAAELLRNWNLEKEEITDIYYENTGERNEHAYYVGEGYVIKFTADPDKLQNHIQLSRVLENAGFPAATPVLTKNGELYIRDGELYFFLAKRLQGGQMTSEDLFSGDFACKARFIGEILGHLHRALEKANADVREADLLQDLKCWAMPKVRSILPVSQEQCGEILHTLEALYPRLPRQIIHRDPNPGNIICGADSWGFIDFELSERNVRIFDPCYAATAVLSEFFDKEDTERLEKWLKIYQNIFRGYDSTAGLCAEERKAVPYVLLANQLVCTVWFSEQEKYRDVFERNRDMTMWLLSVFEKLRLL